MNPATALCDCQPKASVVAHSNLCKWSAYIINADDYVVKMDIRQIVGF